MNLNTKVSGAQMLLVPITTMGKNRFPFVESLNHRVIKYIDFAPAQYLPNTDAAGLTTTTDLFINLVAENGSTFLHRNMPLERFNYQATLGVREPIGETLSLEDCYIDCKNAAAVGTTAALLVWYDLPEFSARNSSDRLLTDYTTIPLTTAIRYNQLPDEERMTGKRFRRILLGTPTVTPDYQEGLPYAQLQNVYLTLCKGSYLVCENIPVMLLYQMDTLHKNEFANIIFDFQSCYLTIGGAGTIPDVEDDYLGKSVFFNLQYEK